MRQATVALLLITSVASAIKSTPPIASLDLDSIDQEMGFGTSPAPPAPSALPSAPPAPPAPPGPPGPPAPAPAPPLAPPSAPPTTTSPSLDTTPTPPNRAPLLRGPNPPPSGPSAAVHSPAPLMTTWPSNSNLLPTGSSAANSIDMNLLHNVQSVTRVIMNTTVGGLAIDVHFDWAPLGAAQFISLVMAGFYDNSYVFRVVPGFVAQFGLNSDSNIQSSYSSMAIEDEKQSHPFVSNTIGTLSFASHGPNSRSTQVFFSLMDNARLDSLGFTPFAKLTDDSLAVSLKFYSEYGEKVDQQRIQQEGGGFLQKEFPLLDKITTARVVANVVANPGQ